MSDSVRVCDVCACGAVNDDWTALDAMLFESDDDYWHDLGHRQMVASSLGCHVDSFELSGYWDCFVCDETQVGSGELFEFPRD